MRRLPVIFGLVALGLAFLVSVGDSQDAKKDKDEKKEKVKGMLPAGFKDLGLTAEQKGKVYSIQGEYRAKIAELDKKIKELKALESVDVFKVLTEEQRDKYLKAKGIETKDKSKDKEKVEKDKK